MKLVVIAFGVAFFSATFMETAEGECCAAVKDLQFTGISAAFTKCGDDTTPTPCCGYGSCNIFCCNCGGGCRQAHRKREEQSPDVDGFEAIDVNRDGRISLTEAENHIKSGSCGNPAEKISLVPSEFARMDLDMDGFLTREEIDSP